MASNSNSTLLSTFLILTMLLVMTHSIDAGRQLSPNTKDTAIKQGAWMKLGKDRGVLIPGIGRIMVPPCFGDTPYSGGGGSSSSTPSYSGSGGSSSSTPSYSGGGGTPTGASPSPAYIPGGDDTPTGASPSPAYIPGGDDTLTPNPGVEIPAPPVLAAAHP